MKYKVMALCGEAGSGKDTILNALIRKNPNLFHLIIGCTTRPPREGEKDGVNYHFLTVDDFAEKISNDEMLEATCFNNWMYGTEYAALSEDKINIGVFNPEGIETLSLDKKIDMYAYYIEVSDKERLIRQLNRETNPDVFEIIRRFRTDCEDFSDLKFYYNIVKNESKRDFKDTINIILRDAKYIARRKVTQ